MARRLSTSFLRSAWVRCPTTGESPSTHTAICLVFQYLANLALSENLRKPFLSRTFLHPLNCEEPTLVTAIRLAMDERHRSGWFERASEGAGLRLNWTGHGERLDERVGVPGP